jgi:hypothetical protein
MVTSGQVIVKEFTTYNAGGVLDTPEALPTVTLWKNGIVGIGATVTNIATGRYRATITLPALAAWDIVQLKAYWNCGGSEVNFEDTVLDDFCAICLTTAISGLTISKEFNTWTAGRVLLDGDVDPVVRVWKNGVSGAAGTVTNITTGTYRMSIALPVFVAGDVLQIRATWTCDGLNFENTILDRTIDDYTSVSVGDVRLGVVYDGGAKTGTLDLPAVADVRFGVSYDALTKTGTLDLPAEADVKDGVHYDNSTKEGSYGLHPEVSTDAFLATALEGIDNLMKATIIHAHPEQVYDGEGTEEAIGAYESLRVGLQYHENEPPVMVFDYRETIQVGDLILTPAA